MRYANFDNGILTNFTQVKTDKTIELNEEENKVAKLGINIVDIYKKVCKSKLWSMISKKEVTAKKIIIGKPEMSDDELETQLKIYWDKYNDAKAGLDVFANQASALGMSQEDYRNLVISKGDEFILQEKHIKDLIEATRQVAEDKVNLIESEDDYKSCLNKLAQTDKLTIEATIDDVLNIWNS